MIKTYYTWEYTKADGRWEQEVFRTLHTVILKLCSDLAAEVGPEPLDLPYRHRAASHISSIIASPSVINALKSLEQFRIRDIINMDRDIHLVGHIGHLEVYRDLMAREDYVVVKAYGKEGKIAITGLSK